VKAQWFLVKCRYHTETWLVVNGRAVGAGNNARSAMFHGMPWAEVRDKLEPIHGAVIEELPEVES
jgi:hypothetical protein